MMHARRIVCGDSKSSSLQKWRQILVVVVVGRSGSSRAGAAAVAKVVVLTIACLASNPTSGSRPAIHNYAA